MKQKINIVLASIFFLIGLMPAHAKMIFGKNNIREHYEMTVAEQEVATGVALILRKSKAEKFLANPEFTQQNSLAARMFVCEGELFETQPSIGDCTGFLVGPDLLMTAGHCIVARTCAETAFTFDFQMNDKIESNTLKAENTYNCKKVLQRNLNLNDSDYALVKLDRPTKNRHVFKRSLKPLKFKQSLTMIGHPLGLPMKIDTDAYVTDTGQDFFYMHADAFSGNSGSPVLRNDTGEVVGILSHTDKKASIALDPNFKQDGLCKRYQYYDENASFGIGVSVLKPGQDRP